VIVDLTHPGLRYVMTHLRAEDAAEVRATIDQGDIELTCRLIEGVAGAKWEARTAEGRPAVVGGFSCVWPGLAHGWLWGTDEWPEVGREVTRFVKRFILPALDRAGFHRIECRPLASNDHRWLKFIGFKPEAVTAQFGQGREDFVLFARTKGHDHIRPH
jgi:hypothetical protein